MKNCLLLVSLFFSAFFPSLELHSFTAHSADSNLPFIVPITGDPDGIFGVLRVQALVAFPTLENFAATVTRGRPDQVAGVYVPKTLALRVIQQPANAAGFVAALSGTATQFGMAAQHGAIGLLAHNYFSGNQFFDLSDGQKVDIIYGDGTMGRYVVSTIRHFQALSPADPYSDFVDLDNGGNRLSSTDVFNQIYMNGRVVFQTCIRAEGNLSWGRLFVTAIPID
jgi:hypothetical protein